jgi:N-acetylmuramoyl-L-alanine amidase
MKIAISSGHGIHIRGARGNPVPPQLDEVDQAIRVMDGVAAALKKAGIGVETFTDKTSHDQNTNLNTIVNWHNSKSRDIDVSVHFNAYDHSAHGCEVLYYSQQSLAKKVCDAIVAAGKFTNRGAKKRTDLFFLNNTEQPAILLEVCFCDHTGDSNLFNQHFDAICQAIAESVSGHDVPDEELPPDVGPPEPPGAELHVNVTIEAPPGVIVHVDVREAGRKADA